MTTPRYLANALALYDARRSLGVPEGRALYSTAAGLAALLDIPREVARRLLVDGLNSRANPSLDSPL